MSKTELLTPAEIEAITKCHGPGDGAVQLLLGHIQALTEQRRWIPCSERMPEDASSVLICVAGCIEMGFRSMPSHWQLERTDSYDIPIGYSNEQVSHWMPLPPAPQEEGKPNE